MGNLTRRDFVRAMALAHGSLSVPGLLAGCAHRDHIRTVSYTEQVSTLLMSKDGRQLVVLGDRYHYVFDSPNDLFRLSQTSFKHQVSAQIEPFVVDANGRVQGHYVLSVKPEGPLPDAQALSGLGFRLDEGGTWQLRGALRGRRYLAGNTLKADRIREELARTYTVTVQAHEYADQQVADDLATPIVVAANGVLLLYYLVLAPVALPVMYLTQEKRLSLDQAFR